MTVMAVDGKSKQDLLREYQLHERDTGSTDVQVALLTGRIDRLAKHLQAHGHDTNSRRGLLIMVGQRRRLLDYLNRTDPDRYAKLIEKLGIRK